MRRKLYLKNCILPTEYKASIRHEYVLSSAENQKLILETLQSLFSPDVSELIFKLAYSVEELCKCTYTSTCALCSFACCKRAFRKSCTCSISIVSTNMAYHVTECISLNS